MPPKHEEISSKQDKKLLINASNGLWGIIGSFSKERHHRYHNEALMREKRRLDFLFSQRKATEILPQCPLPLY